MNSRSVIYLMALTLTLLSLPSCSFRQTPETDNLSMIDTGKILKTYFKDQIEYKQSEKDNTLLYCPDETCDIFVMNDTVNINILNDFVYLMFVSSNVSNYPNMLAFKSNQLPEHVGQVLKRNAERCVFGKEFEKCVIAEMQTRYRIKSLFVRYDEKTRHEEEIDILEMISK